MASPKRNQVEQAVVRLAQMARACGIHLILAMQSPRKDVITGLIKTNIPGRISFKVSSKIDSRVILDESGAERLLSKGDMLFLTPGSSKIKRCHGPFISEENLSIIINHWKSQGGPQYHTIEKFENENFDIHSTWNDSDEDMEKYMEIRSYVASLKTISTSSLQRKFRLGYPRAARMMERFEEEGIVGLLKEANRGKFYNISKNYFCCFVTLTASASDDNVKTLGLKSLELKNSRRQLLASLLKQNHVLA